MKILITGACGFIGTNIALTARKKNYKVIGIDSLIRKGSKDNMRILSSAGVTIVTGDVRKKENFASLPSVDAIIHLAANPAIPWSITDPRYDFETNTLGTFNALEFARKRGKIPFIYASTNRVYSDLVNKISLDKTKTRYAYASSQKKIILGSSHNGINENFPIDGFGAYAHSPYGVSKLSGDLYCQEYFQTYNIPTVINRMSCIYGYYQKGVTEQGWVDHFIRTIGFGNKKITIHGDGKQLRDMLWGEDLAELYLRQLEKIDSVKGEVFNVGGGYKNTLSIIEAVKIIEEISHQKANIEYDQWRHADQKIYISDIKKIEKKLLWKPKVSPSQGILKMYNQYLKPNDNLLL